MIIHRLLCIVSLNSFLRAPPLFIMIMIMNGCLYVVHTPCLHQQTRIILHEKLYSLLTQESLLHVDVSHLLSVNAVSERFHVSKGWFIGG